MAMCHVRPFLFPAIQFDWYANTLTIAVTFSITGQSNALIVLSQLDSRYFRDIAGRSSWTMDFALVREGEKEPLAESLHSDFYLRSVNLEIELEAGNYIVYVCFAKYRRVLFLTNLFKGSFGSHT